jgi:hypothetical protein
MILLTSTSDAISLITSSTANISVHASYVDVSGTTVTPGRDNTLIVTATTTTIVASPAASTQRTVKSLIIRNTHASSTNQLTLQHTDGTDTVILFVITLSPGWALYYDEGNGFVVIDNTGRRAQNLSANSVSPSVNSLNTIVLASDVTNNNAVANTLQDVTGLSFAVTAGEAYWFRAQIPYTAAATTTGSRWTLSGPAITSSSYRADYTLTNTTRTINDLTTFGLPSAANASSLTAGNTAIVEGIASFSASGTLQIQFASEVASSAIVAKAGAILQWMRVL